MHNMIKKTKIIATIGPATASVEMLVRLIDAGVDIFRVNFSHNSFSEHEKLIRNIRKASKHAGCSPAILQDLPGPKVRIKGLKEAREICANSKITFSRRCQRRNDTYLQVNYPSIFEAIKKGDPILIDDGLIRLQVVKSTPDILLCRTVVGGLLKPNKGVNFPSSSWQSPVLTVLDRKAIAFGLRHNVDFIALSFVRDEKNLAAARRLLRRGNSKAKLIAKIERPMALDNLDQILDAADGVMVARGDLAIETSMEKVPFLQKEIIRKANEKNVAVIVATQMLESMTEHAVPTRAEVSDVANAVIDGADALMLSAETAVGKHPVAAVAMMAGVIREAEQQMQTAPGQNRSGIAQWKSLHEAISQAALAITDNFSNNGIIIFTNNGYMARLLSKQRPAVDIFAFTANDTIMRQLNLERGVIPFLVKLPKNEQQLIHSVTNRLKRAGFGKQKGYWLVVWDAALISGTSDSISVIHM